MKEAVITTIGYPFSYQQGQIYKWLIQFSEGRYIKFVFTNVSLGKTQQVRFVTLGEDIILVEKNMDGSYIKFSLRIGLRATKNKLKC